MSLHTYLFVAILATAASAGFIMYMSLDEVRLLRDTITRTLETTVGVKRFEYKHLGVRIYQEFRRDDYHTNAEWCAAYNESLAESIKDFPPDQE